MRKADCGASIDRFSLSARPNALAGARPTDRSFGRVARGASFSGFFDISSRGRSYCLPSDEAIERRLGQ
jgi:hypothetical protein